MRVHRYNYADQFGGNVDKLLNRYRQILLQGEYILTEDVHSFEQNFARYLELQYAQGVNSGTDALMVALLSLGIGAGDEVITQANTFYASVTAICLVGATPVLVDAEEEGFTMDHSQLEDAITTRTRALMPVHLYGRPAPMGTILSLARKYGLFVVEDAAQAVGARWRNRRVGGLGDVGCFSFHPSKNLAAAGDAGAVVTNNFDLNEKMRLFKELGQNGQNVHDVVGINSKLDAMQALVLSTKLVHLDGWNARRREIAKDYRKRLQGLPLRFQAESDDEEHVWHLFQVRTEKRDALLKALRKDGIDAVVRYPSPIHLQGAFHDRGWKKGQFPVSEALANELLCLPIRPDLSDDEIDYVCEATTNFFGTNV